MVLVNTVVLVRGDLGLGASALGWTMAAFGAGSMLYVAGALALVAHPVLGGRAPPTSAPG